MEPHLAISCAAMATQRGNFPPSFSFLSSFLAPSLTGEQPGVARALANTHFSRFDRGLFESPRWMGEYTPFQRLRDFPKRETFICRWSTLFRSRRRRDRHFRRIFKRDLNQLRTHANIARYLLALYQRDAFAVIAAYFQDPC